MEMDQQFLDLLLNIERISARTESKLDAHLAQHDKDREDEEAYKLGTEKRLEKLEARYNGFIAGLGVAVVAVGAKLGGFFG